MLVSVSLLVIGCAKEDPRVLEMRRRLSMESEPADVTTIEEAKNSLHEHPNVLIAARIVDDEYEAFIDRQAAFIVTEIVPDDHTHGGNEHDAANCPFCSRKANALRAAVQFVDDSGKPIGIDARELFSIHQGDTVVVAGKGELIPGLDMLQITAERIFVRTGSAR
ncbi:MAG: hypothetical protein KDA99_12915 [Planctomycetales bacterium]|nr:hypothetical protein [Planctomycetales bacterium]